MDELNSAALREKVHRWVLPNGLTVYVDARPE